MLPNGFILTKQIFYIALVIKINSTSLSSILITIF